MLKKCLNRFFAIFTTLLLFCVAFPAMAGEYVEGIYTSNLGYSFEPPTDWVKVDASTFHAASADFPRSFRKLKIDQLDVMFYPKQDGVGKKSDKYINNIMVVPLKAMPSEKSEDAAKAIAAEALKNFQSDPTSYKDPMLMEVSFDDSRTSSFVMNWSYKDISNKTIYIEQHIYFLSKFTLVLSCNVTDESELRMCKSIAKSMDFSDLR